MEPNYLWIYWTDFHIFHQMVGICVNGIDPDLFFQFLKWRCHGNQIYGKIWVYTHLFGTVAFQNQLQYRHSDSKIFSGNILATSCVILNKIGPVTPEITTVINTPFWMRWQLAYPTEYLSNYTTHLHSIFSNGRCVYGNYKTDISCTVVQGTLLW